MSDGNDKVEETKPAAKKAVAKKATAKKAAPESETIAWNSMVDDLILDNESRKAVPESEIQAAHDMRIQNMDESARMFATFEAHTAKYEARIEWLKGLKK